MTPVERLRKIVADAKGDDLEQHRYWSAQGGSTISKSLLDLYEERAEWQAASDLLERLIRIEALASDKGRAMTGARIIQEADEV